VRPQHRRAARQDHHVRLAGEHVVDARPDPEVNGRAGFGGGHFLVVVDAADVLPAGQLGMQVRLASGPFRRSKNRDLVSPGGGHPTRLQACGTGARDHDAPLAAGRLRPVVHFIGLRKARVVVAEDRLALDDRGPAGVAGHAVADLGLPAFRRLLDPGRIRDQRTAHRHHLCLARGQYSFSFRRVGNQTQGHERHAGRVGRNLRVPLDIRGARVAHVRDVRLQRMGVRTVAIDQVMKAAGLRQAGGDARGLGMIDASRNPVSARKF